MSDKKISTENLDTPPPLILKLFDYRKFSETQHSRVPLRNSSALWDKKFLTENRDTPSAILSTIFFDYRKFSETQHRRVPLRNSSALWDRKIMTENRDTPPLLSINFLATGRLMKRSTESFPYGILPHCQTKKFWQKIVILPTSSHLLSSVNFFDTRI